MIDAIMEGAEAFADAAIIGTRPESAVEKAALLSPIEYDRQRHAIAEGLGIRVKTLDDEVNKIHAENAPDSTHGRRLNLPLPERWPENVHIGKLLDELCEALKRHVIMSDAARHGTALWIAHTWVYTRFDHTPRLAITSPAKRCGKSTLLTVLIRTCRCVLKADNISASGVFRTVESLSPLTLLIDEADSFLRDNEELRGVLNSGFERSGSAIRVVEIKGEWQPVQFRTFAPVALAAIGNIPGTLEDRALPIRLERKAAGDSITKFRDAGAGERLDDLARKLARWGGDNPGLSPHPAIPATLNDREGDISAPLLAIADAAGGEWPARARQALVAIFCGRAEQEGTAETGAMLLADIKAIMPDSKDARMVGAKICERLAEMEERPWPEWRHGKPMTPTQLAHALRPFGIRPKNQRQPSGAILKGYERDSFADAWHRYLPPETPPPCSKWEDQTATRYIAANIIEVSKTEAATPKPCSGLDLGKDAENSSHVARSGLNPPGPGESGQDAGTSPADEVEL